MPAAPSPKYSLADMQAKIEIGQYQITRSAKITAADLEMDEEDIKECICALTAAEFYKTMPSETVEGAFQDVYRTQFLAKSIYTKLTLGPRRKTVVISFKRDESA